MIYCITFHLHMKSKVNRNRKPYSALYENKFKIRFKENATDPADSEIVPSTSFAKFNFDATNSNPPRKKDIASPSSIINDIPKLLKNQLPGPMLSHFIARIFAKKFPLQIFCQKTPTPNFLPRKNFPQIFCEENFLPSVSPKNFPPNFLPKIF